MVLHARTHYRVPAQREGACRPRSPSNGGRCRRRKQAVGTNRSCRSSSEMEGPAALHGPAWVKWMMSLSSPARAGARHALQNITAPLLTLLAESCAPGNLHRRNVAPILSLATSNLQRLRLVGRVAGLLPMLLVLARLLQSSPNRST
jgi:hypothetical protein